MGDNNAYLYILLLDYNKLKLFYYLFYYLEYYAFDSKPKLAIISLPYFDKAFGVFGSLIYKFFLLSVALGVFNF